MENRRNKHQKTILNKQFLNSLESLLISCNEKLLSSGKLVKNLNLHINAETGDLDLVVEENHLSQELAKRPEELKDKTIHDRLAIKLNELSSSLQDAKQCMLQDELAQAEYLVQNALVLAQTTWFQDSIRICTIFLREIEFLQSYKNCQVGQMSCIRALFHLDSQNIFYLYHKGTVYLGKKQLSQRFLAGKLEDMYCGLITEHMILGPLQETRVDEQGLRVYFRPLSAIQQRHLFLSVTKNKESYIDFPFPFFDDKHKEIKSDSCGWDLDAATLKELRQGEEPFRDYIQQVLSPEELAGMRVYDPACSTGDFLSSIKSIEPSCMTIGQDVSREMIGFAKPRIDFAILGDAIESPIEDHSIDIAFIRFLNSQVVTTDYAEELFKAICARIKPGGCIYLFGHTPVLLSPSFFDLHGYDVMQSLGYEPESNSIFQFYQLKKDLT